MKQPPSFRIAALACVLAIAGCYSTDDSTHRTIDPEAAALPPHRRPPNIVFILADDLGYAELGRYGQKKIRTPHLDRLADQGLRFTAAYAGSPVCAPSRCVFLTGKHPGHAAVRDNREVQPEGQAPMPASEVTLAEFLKSRGYATGAFGKWGLGAPGSESEPNRHGFDRFYGYNCQRVAHSYYPGHLWSDTTRVTLDNDPPVPGHAGLPAGADPTDPKSYERFQGQDYAPDRIHDQALAFIRDHRDRPFFLYYASILPHVALHVPNEDLQPYLALGWNDPPFTRDRGGYTPHFTPRAAYAAMISRLDRYVGNVLRTLDELGLADDTIVVFTSDNGTTHLKQEVDYDFFESVGPLRGLKGSVYEGGLRVPQIVRWPGPVRPGTVTSVRTGSEDWFVTFRDILASHSSTTMEATPPIEPERLDGVSILPVLRGETIERPFLYREFRGYGGQQAVWKGRWKAVRRGLLRKNNPDPLAIELYDLESDPSESTNVAAEHPSVVVELRDILEREHEPSATFPIPVLD